MLENRAVKVAIIVWWLGSLAWLVNTKFVRWNLGNSIPVQRFQPVEQGSRTSSIEWDIEYKTKSVGSSHIEIRPDITGTHVISKLELNQLPLHDMLQDVSAILPLFAQANGLTKNDMLLSLQISTRMDLDSFGEFERLESTVSFSELGELFVARVVRLKPTELNLVVLPGKDLPPPWQSKGDLIRDVIEIPKNAMMSDLFSPVSNLESLHVGQTWIVQSFRPFPGNRPMREMTAKVERVEIVPWAGDAEPAFVVSLRDNDPVLVALAEPTVELWVLRAGMVIQQRLRLGNLQIDFVRREERPLP
jgi:hypothetical protein